jgi:hypothetical protein
MKSLKFQGNSNDPSSCKYALTELGDKKAIIFYQPELTGARVTAVIESLTMHVLANDLPGVPPGRVRVFEYHNPELHPAEEWREVTFNNSGITGDNKGNVRLLVEILMAPETPLEYFVDDPEWHSVPEEDVEILSKVLPAITVH